MTTVAYANDCSDDYTKIGLGDHGTGRLARRLAVQMWVAAIKAVTVGGLGKSGQILRHYLEESHYYYFYLLI